MHITIRPDKNDTKVIKALMRFYNERTASKSLQRAAKEMPPTYKLLKKTEAELEESELKYERLVNLLREKADLDKSIADHLKGKG